MLPGILEIFLKDCVPIETGWGGGERELARTKVRLRIYQPHLNLSAFNTSLRRRVRSIEIAGVREKNGVTENLGTVNVPPRADFLELFLIRGVEVPCSARNNGVGVAEKRALHSCTWAILFKYNPLRDGFYELLRLYGDRSCRRIHADNSYGFIFFGCRSTLEMSGRRCANNFTCPTVASIAGSALSRFTFGKSNRHSNRGQPRSIQRLKNKRRISNISARDSGNF